MLLSVEETWITKVVDTDATCLMLKLIPVDKSCRYVVAVLLLPSNEKEKFWEISSVVSWVLNRNKMIGLMLYSGVRRFIGTEIVDSVKNWENISQIKRQENDFVSRSSL